MTCKIPILIVENRVFIVTTIEITNFASHQKLRRCKKTELIVVQNRAQFKVCSCNIRVQMFQERTLTLFAPPKSR
jgi:hypothetical protein